MKTNSRAIKLWVTAIVCVLIVSVTAATLMACGSGAREGIPEYSYTVNGYQQYVDVASRSDMEGVVSVDTMLQTTGLSMDNPADQLQIASNIYNMAVRNYNAASNAAYMVHTEAAVKAVGVKGTGFLKFSSKELNVGLTSTYSAMRGDNGSFSQTVSGVTKLQLDGALGKIADSIKGNFGYNTQSFSNKDITATRTGGNGGAEFPGAKGGAEKYICGAYCDDFPVKPGKSYKVNAAEASEPSKPEEIQYQWDPLKENIASEFENAGSTYYMGNYGTGWATYNFDKSFLDPEKTTVTYNPETKIYEISFVYLEEKIDEACKFAKSSLINDTKNYIQLPYPTYTKCENVIRVYDNGLIASWKRSEYLGSSEAAKVVVLPADCSGGGSTGNEAFTVFSYDPEVDCNALQLAALYWPELGTEKGNPVKPLDFSSCKFANLDAYKPTVRK